MAHKTSRKLRSNISTVCAKFELKLRDEARICLRERICFHFGPSPSVRVSEVKLEFIRHSKAINRGAAEYRALVLCVSGGALNSLSRRRRRRRRIPAFEIISSPTNAHTQI